MKFATSADWRDGIAFDTPMLVADLLPGEPTRCAVCGIDSPLKERTDLWAMKHRHPNDHGGFVRFYCASHLPVIEVRVEPTAPPRAAAPRKPRAAASERQPAARRAGPDLDRVRTMCPDCYVEVSAKGLCGICGNQVV